MRQRNGKNRDIPRIREIYRREEKLLHIECSEKWLKEEKNKNSCRKYRTETNCSMTKIKKRKKIKIEVRIFFKGLVTQKILVNVSESWNPESQI